MTLIFIKNSANAKYKGDRERKGDTEKELRTIISKEIFLTFFPALCNCSWLK